MHFLFFNQKYVDVGLTVNLSLFNFVFLKEIFYTFVFLSLLTLIFLSVAELQIVF